MSGSDKHETRYATGAAGHRIAYDHQGGGEKTIVMLCGILMNRRRWHEAGYVKHFSPSSSVITIDPLGHGESDKPYDVHDYAPDQLADHVACVLNAEEIETAIIWGYSRGGRMACMFAEAHPDRVDLAILGGSPIGVPAEFAAPPSQVEALTAGEWEQFWAAFPAPLPDPVMDYMMKTNDPRAVGAALGAWGADKRPWDQLPVPAIGHLGDGEVFLEQAIGRAQQIGIPLAVLPTGGHAETFMATDRVLPATEPYLRL